VELDVVRALSLKAGESKAANVLGSFSGNFISQLVRLTPFGISV
jgi:hypothetical protein